jgi:hypothetical protein
MSADGHLQRSAAVNATSPGTQETASKRRLDLAGLTNKLIMIYSDYSDDSEITEIT